MTLKQTGRTSTAVKALSEGGRFMTYKKALSVFLALCMALTLFAGAVPAFAEDVDWSDPTTWPDAAEWTQVNSSDALSSAVASGGLIRLTADITGDTIEIPAGVDVVLDLNGKTLRRTAPSLACNNTRVINVLGSLTVVDGSGTNAGTITGGYVGRQGHGAGICVNAGASLALYGGAIHANAVSSGYGGGVSVEPGGAFEMYGGVISKNVAAGIFRNGVGYLGGGAGVYVGGTFTMNGGLIKGNGNGVQTDYNIETSWGGGVFVDNGATFTMNGGQIGNNDMNGGNYVTKGGAAVCLMDRYDTPNEGDLPSVFYFNGGTIYYGNISDGGKGAGIYVSNNAKCTMTGDAKIEGCLGNAGVYVDDEFVMESGSIIKGKAGGIIVGNNGSVKMTGGTIGGEWRTVTVSDDLTVRTSDGNGHSLGGGVYMLGGTFEMSGDAEIVGNSATQAGGGVYIAPESANDDSVAGHGVFTMSGNASIRENVVLGYDTSSFSSLRDGDGGGVWVGPDGRFIMQGGSITGNRTPWFVYDDEHPEVNARDWHMGWGAWTVVTPATETEKGLESRECGRCGEKQERDILPEGQEDPTPKPTIKCECIERLLAFIKGVIRLLKHLFDPEKIC